MMQLPSALHNRTLHFKNLNRYARDGYPAAQMPGKFWQIDAEIYDEFLNMLPPIYVPQIGFTMCESLCDSATGRISATYMKIGQGYWCAYTDTTITPPIKMYRHIARTLAKGYGQ